MEKLKAQLGDRLRENETLSKHTTFRIGGPARYFAICNTQQEIVMAVETAFKSKLNFEIIGGGSNILFSDNGFDGLIIKTANSKIKVKGNEIECDAGAILAKVLGESVSVGLTGLEWAAGIPGTIGGAIRGNAGAYGQDISMSVKEILVLENGKIKKLCLSNCKFKYRESVFKEEKRRYLILSAILKLEKGNMEESRQKIKEIIKERSKKFSGFSAGCVFKNIEMSDEGILEFKNRHDTFPDQFVRIKKVPAAWLIDGLGLKGQSIGDAQISNEHAGIIINKGKATAENVIMLISIIKQKVRDHYSLQLMEEIEYLGFN